MRAEELEKLVRFKDNLNPDIWQNNNLRREVEYKLLLIAKEFIEFINIPDLKLKDITLSGSNASYNYNDHSDLDLHLIVDMDTPCGAQLKELFQAKKSQFNDQYDILIRGHEVEVYVQDAKQPHISNGIYSVIKDEWLKQPEKISANPDETNIKHKYEFLKAEIDRAIESGDPRAIARLQLKIKDMRKAGLEKSGEYGVENLAFKLLRNDGSLDALYSAKQKADDEKLSLPENFADGKKPGRKGLAKRMGVPTGASVTRLRQIAKNSTGEKARMAHWMANMKSGKKKAKIDELTAYHGTADTITQFRPLTHFGSIKAAEDRMTYKKIKGRVYEVDLDINNPAVIKDFPGVHSATQFAFALKKAKIFTQDEMLSVTTIDGDGTGVEYWLANKDRLEREKREQLIKLLKSKGYDGMAYVNRYEDKGHTSYVILDSNQAKIVKEITPEKKD